ncbi:MAG: hypothetical protein VX664_11445, partial [Chloroflexota bacterium]|nr:hypothetical protein [Chloroflexota bacterium]
RSFAGEVVDALHMDGDILAGTEEGFLRMRRDVAELLPQFLSGKTGSTSQPYRLCKGARY